MELYAHQKRLVEILRTSRRYYAAWACGTGKTIGVLSACADRPMPTLVLAPLSTLGSAWGNDAQLFADKLRTVIVRGTSAQRKRLIAVGADIFVTNYDAFKPHADDYLRAGVRRLVIDEAVKVKNPDAAITKKSITFADKMESVVLLSGYPAPQGPQDWWSQMRCVDRACLGDSFWSYAYRFATPVKQKLRDGREFIAKYAQTPQQSAALAERLKPWVWSLSKSECLDLPAQTNEIREFDLSGEEAEFYANARDRLRFILDQDHKESRIKAEAQLMKLRQITGGGAIVDGSVWSAAGAAKIDGLLEFVGELGPEEPVVVWAEFRHEIRRIEAELSALGPTATLFGDNSDKAAQIVADFASGKTRFLVANPATAGHGTNGMQARCSYAVFYSYGYNSDQHVQARDRIHRSGMRDRPATYIYLCARGTVDESALRVLGGKAKRGFSMLDALREAVVITC